MQRKLYKYNYSILLLVLFSIVCGVGVICLVFSIIFRKTDDFIALFVCGLVITFIGVMFILFYFFCDAFTPIYLTENGIKKKENAIDWKDIKITLYPPPSRGACCYYYLIVDRQYITELTALKSAIIHGISIRLSKKVLDIILPYCQSKLLVLNCNGKYDNMKATHKINLIINRFNNGLHN